MMRIVLLFGLGGLVVAACSSAGKAGSPITVEGPTRHVLHNGVRVLIQVYPSSQVVAVQLWVRAGSRDEAAAELGLAHYLEHMLFKGTTTRWKVRPSDTCCASVLPFTYCCTRATFGPSRT